MTVQTRSKTETQKLGKEFAQKIKSGGVVCLYGNLGAGKTTFTQGVAEGLGIKQSIISPTFILVRRYELPVYQSTSLPVYQFLWHIDLYRLNDIDEAKGIGIEEIMGDPKNIVLIEWPEKIETLLPHRYWVIKLTSTGENAREITITKNNPPNGV